jgi:hypothetical protein
VTDEYTPVADVLQTHYPKLAASVDACLSVFGSMAIQGRTKPLSLIFETPSGFGKTAILQMVSPIESNPGMEPYAYRSDKFTPKSFVTHAANVKKSELANMDLLPKLRDKVLVTKELAPIFRGRVEELQENFSILISVLDGQGFSSDTGMQGQRGYQKPMIFNWVGATTPLPQATHRLMSQLGTRLLFYEVPAIPPTEDEMVAYALNGDAGTAEIMCRCTVHRFLRGFFKKHPVGGTPSKSIRLSEAAGLSITRWTEFLCQGRAEITHEKDGSNWMPIAAMPPEGPWKVINYFKDLARGHALIHGRCTIDDSDLQLVSDVAISSIPGHIRPLVRYLRKGKELDSGNAARLVGVSGTTARKYLTELSLLGIADLTKGAALTSSSSVVTLSKKYKWLRESNP